MLSLIETAKQQGLNAVPYIRDLLTDESCGEMVGYFYPDGYLTSVYRCIEY